MAQQPSAARLIAIDISAQPLGDALAEFGKQVDLAMVFYDADLGRDLKAPHLAGTFTADDALARLLSNTGLRYEYLDERTIAIRALKSGPETTSDAASLPGDDPRNAGSGLLRVARTAADATQGMQQVAADADDGRPVGESQQADGVSKDEKSKEIVVTGSRLAGAPSQLAANVLVLDAEDLRATGQSTLEGVLRQLPQNMFGATEIGAAIAGSGASFNGALNITGGSSVNLRGLGSESSLILVDGRRIGKSGVFGGISDISGVPLSAVERVEILLDGASSIYGSDAVGGVVNVILKKDYDGVEAAYEYATPEQGGFDEQIVTVSGGTGWGGGRVRATFEHFQRSNLDGAERPERIARSFYQAPAMLQGFPLFYRYNGQNYLPSQLAGLGLTSSSPGVQRFNYAVAPGGQDGSSLSVADISTFDSSFIYDLDASEGISLIPAQKRSSLQLGFDQALPWLGDEVSLTGSLYYSQRDTYAANGAFYFQGSMPATGPANPFEATTSIYWSIPSLPDRHYQTDQQVSRWNLALDGGIGRDWRWSVAAGQSRDRIKSRYFNNPIPGVYFTPALLQQYQQQGRVIDLRLTELVDAGLNLFAGDIDAVNSPQLLAGLVEPQAQNVLAINLESSAEIGVSGSLFRLPGGDMYMAAGVEWREETLETGSEIRVGQTDLMSNISLPVSGFDAVESGRVQQSAYAELLVPVIGAANAVAGAQALTLTGAARYDSYDHYGGDTIWSLGLIWRPVDQATFKINQATSYVVPTPREGLIPPSYTNYPQISPVTYPNGQPVNLIDENGVPTGEVDYLGITIFGGNPDLQPETASSLAAGVEIRPDVLPGFTLSATWHRTDYTNRIGAAPVVQYFAGSDYVAYYPNLTRDAENGWLIRDYRAINYASVDVEGVDYRLRYDRETELGHLVLTANVGYTSKYERILLAGDEPINEVANVGFESHRVIPAYRYSTNLGWYRGGLAVNLDISTASRTVSTGLRSGSILRRTGKAAVLTDLLFSYDLERSQGVSVPGWLQNSAVALNILNVLDSHPEYSVDNLTTGQPHSIPEMNANLADPRGRMFYLKLTKRF